jgi:hypothetical protein
MVFRLGETRQIQIRPRGAPEGIVKLLGLIFDKTLWVAIGIEVVLVLLQTLGVTAWAWRLREIL